MRAPAICVEPLEDNDSELVVAMRVLRLDCSWASTLRKGRYLFSSSLMLATSPVWLSRFEPPLANPLREDGAECGVG